MIPDIASVAFIRDALWRHKGMGKAAIMIGAGFSFNAEKLSATSRPMPDWSQMAVALCEPLYPFDSIRRQKALREASGTSGFLRIAQEFRTAFGADALSTKIKELVPDAEHRPGELHGRLLNLPWADVFSTNWDTLLERATVDAFERRYDIVQTIEQVPSAARPRIVKLHGTFPAHEPFIFAEEDYRTYPRLYAPLVNLVQQSMMENIFCLLGFSGDDPNFLHWAGWVRDNLGARAPKIYLVGWLDISVHRRRLLESHGIMPIDLMHIPGAASWPEESRHRYATEWFIRTLEEARPYDPANWPGHASQLPPAPSHLGPIPGNNHPFPLTEIPHPTTNVAEAERLKALEANVDIWAHNRRLYPGWLIAPEDVRQRLWQFTEGWFREFVELLEKLTPVSRLQALAELTWRLNKALFPLPADFESVALETLSSFDKAGKTVEDIPIPWAQFSELVTGAREIAFALARNARHLPDQEKFDTALHLAKRVSVHDVELDDRLIYERALWHLAKGDLQALEAELTGWSRVTGDPIWQLRKAGLLSELGNEKEAGELLGLALSAFRRTVRKEIDDIYTLSRESWALYLALAYVDRTSHSIGPQSQSMPEPFQRWRELASIGCDAWTDYQALARLLEPEPQPPQDVTRRKRFDPDQEGVTVHWRTGYPKAILAAYQMVLLAEETGIPPTAGHMVLFKKGLMSAARHLQPDEPWTASQLTLRSVGSSTDNQLDDVFSRDYIVSLNAVNLSSMTEGLLRRIEYGLKKMQNPSADVMDWTNTVGVSIEVLSRVAVRLKPEALEKLLPEALAFYRSRPLRHRSLMVGGAVGNLLARILEAMPHKAIEQSLIDLFKLPLVHEINDHASEQRLNEPIATFPENFTPTKRPIEERDEAWRAVIAHLLSAMRGGDLENRKAATLRVYKLSEWDMLTASERNAFINALWTPRWLTTDGLPGGTAFFDWVVLQLPHPIDVDPKQLLQKCVSRLASDTAKPWHERSQKIGDIFLNADRLGTPIYISDETRTSLVDIVENWTKTRLSKRSVGFLGGDEDRREDGALKGIRAILPRISFTPELWNEIWTKVYDLNSQPQRGIRAYSIYPVLMRLRPDREWDLVAQLRRAMGSDNKRDAHIAVWTLYEWTREAMRRPETLLLPAQSLFDEVGISIASRRSAILRIALDIARWLFDDCFAVAQTLTRDCEAGLGDLLNEAIYGRNDVTYDVPGVRAAASRLAVSMKNRELSGPGVLGWLKAAEDDPLPEVRHALDGLKSVK